LFTKLNSYKNVAEPAISGDISMNCLSNCGSPRLCSVLLGIQSKHSRCRYSSCRMYKYTVTERASQLI